MLSVLQKIKEFILILRNSKYLSLVAVLALVAIIPFTVIVSQITQDTRQRAAEKKFALKIPDRFKGQFKNPEYVQGEVVVKFKFPVGKIKPKPEKMAQGLNIDKKAIAFSDLDPQTLPISLTAINQKYKIKQIEKIFKGADSPQKQLAKIKQSFSQDIASGKRKINEKELSKIDLSKTFRISLEDNSQLGQIINDLNNRPDIEYAEYNYIYKTSYIMNDPYYLDSYPSNVGNRDPAWNPSYDYQWNLKKINTEQSWTSVASNSSVIVAVVDTGIDYTHPDLGACSLEQVNNNQCLKIVPGYNFVNSTNDPMDDHGHGTHVAGTIASITNNIIGIAGMNPPNSGIKIMPMKGLDSQGSGTLANLSAAIVQAAQNGAKVINMSYGPKDAYNPESTVEQEALSQAFNLGVVLVAAAGNSGQNISDGFWPANNPYVIAVSATDTQDQKASFSNYGSKISVAAPGVDILSLRAKNTDMYCPDSCNTHIVGQQYYRSNGTSMASPHVAGFSALLLSKDATYSNLEVRTLIEKYATDLGTPGFDQSFGYGRINVQASLAGTLPAIGEIYDPSNNGYVGKNFQVTGTVGGKTFSSYKLELGQGTSPTTWSTDGITLISGGTKPITNDLIGTVLLSSSQTGNFVLRLSVTSNTGEITEKKVSITLDTDLKTGWPKTMDYKGSSSLDQSYFVASDLNGDGKKELAASSYSGNVYVWDNNGQSLTGWPKYLGGDLGGRADNVLAVGDFKGDGKKELVIRSYKAQCDQGYLIGDTCYRYTLSTEIHLLNTDGSEANSSWPKVGPVYSYSSPVISNIDIDNKPKIVVFNAVDNKLHILDYQGNDSTVDLSAGGSNYMSIGDINGDGKKEIVFAKDSSIIAYQYNNTNIATLLWNKNIDSPSWAKPTLADIDHDGKLEVIIPSSSSISTSADCKVWVLRYDGNNQSGWPQNDFTNQGNCDRSPVAVGDINNDGLLDLIWGTSQGRIMLYGADGVIENIFYGDSFYSNLNKGIALADINGDGYSEIVAGSSKDQDFFAWDYNGNFLSNWPKHVLIYSAPQIADIDNDGKVNIVALGKDNFKSNYKIFVWKFNSALSNSYLDYPLYGFNEQRTSNWVPARVVNTPTPTVYLSPAPTPTPISVPSTPVILNPGKAVNFKYKGTGQTSSDYVVISDNNASLAVGNDMTIETWIRLDQNIDEVSILNKHYKDKSDYVYSLGTQNYDFISNRSKPTFFIKITGGELVLRSDDVIHDDGSEWTHLAVTKKGTEVKLFVNGVLKKSGTLAGQVKDQQAALVSLAAYLWNGPVSTSFFGAIDDLRISNNARDIEDNWKNGVYFQPLQLDTNTIALWRFENNLQDSSSNHLDGTSFGNISYENGRVSLPPTPTPTPTPIPQIRVSFRTSSGAPISQKFCSACFNSSGGYVKSYACYTSSDVTIPKPAVCSGNTYNPTIGIDTKRSDIVNGTIAQVTANPTTGFKSLYNNTYLGWTDGTNWTSGERTLNIIVNPRPTPTPYRRITPTVAPFVCTCAAADINKDGFVNVTDYSFLSGCYMKNATDKNQYGQSCASADINGDGVVNGGDYACWSTQYRKKCQ